MPHIFMLQVREPALEQMLQRTPMYSGYDMDTTICVVWRVTRQH